MARTNTTTGGGGGGAVTGLTGNPTEIVYIDNSGNGTGDNLFTRDSATGNTNILALFTGDLAGGFSIDTAAQNTNAGVLDLVTNESALFEGLVSGGGMRTQMTYRKPSTNVLGQFVLQESGNSLIWDANTGDTIITKLEQNEDILGLGGLAGSALTWEDSSTQVQAFIGAVDASAVGLFPGSVLMVTNNNATGASANIVTNYDNTLNVATAAANVANGNFDSGFAFDDGRMVVRYRNTTTGFESAFESDINGAMSRYKLNTATDEYSTQLSNGVFQFFNSTTADQYMSLGGTTGIFQFGDISGASNDTKFIINDSAQIITNHVDGVFTVEDGAASSIAYIDAANRQSIFGNVSSAGGIKMYIDETVGINVQAPGAILNLGANTFGNETNLQVDDTTGIIKALIPTGGDFEVVNAAGNVAFTVIPDNFYTKIGDADNVGNSTSLIVDDATQSIAVSKPFTLKGYTVATLPTGVVGNTAYVTDALTPVFGATAVGGGAVTVPVFFDGATWIVG